MPVPVLVEATTTLSGSSAGGHSVDRPSTIADDDVLLWAVYGRDEATFFNTPSGWTALTSIVIGTVGNPAAGTLQLFGKRITNAAGEPAQYNMSYSGAQHVAAAIARITGAALAGNFWEGAVGAEDTTLDGNWQTPAVVTQGPDRLIVRVVGVKQGVSGVPNFSWESPASQAWFVTAGSNVRFQSGATQEALTAGTYPSLDANHTTVVDRSVGLAVAILPADVTPPAAPTGLTVEVL